MKQCGKQYVYLGLLHLFYTYSRRRLNKLYLIFTINQNNNLMLKVALQHKILNGTMLANNKEIIKLGRMGTRWPQAPA